VSTRPARTEELELNLQCYELRRGDAVLRLEKIPMELLILLVEHKDRLVSREEIIERLWGKAVFLDTEQGINTAIRKIRQVLHDDPERPRFVQTVFGKGYRFIAPILVTHNGLQPRSEAAPSRGVTKRSWKILILAGVFVAALTAAAMLRFHRVQALTEKDTIVIADFANTTGDAVFDETLRQALAVQLEQSPFLSIVSDKRIQQTLAMMGQRPDVELTPEIAREVCQRTASAAVLAGSIAQIGAKYSLILRAVSCANGESFTSTGAEASDKSYVLDALGKASSDIRKKLGESLSTIEKFDMPLAQATTPSLDALKAFSLGAKALDGGDFTASIPALQRAIALDPNFAMAYSALAGNYVNLGEGSLAMENAKKAYELREHATELEEFAIEANYQTNVTGDLEKARHTYEFWAQTYPRNGGSHFNLGNLYNSIGQHEKALVEARESFRLSSHESLDYGYLSFAYATVGRLKEARATAEEALAKNLDSPSLRTVMYMLAFLQNDRAGMTEQMAWAAGKPGVEDVLLAMEADTVAYSGQLGKAREFSRRAVDSAERAQKKETAAGYEADAALREALFGNAAQARKRAAAALNISTGREVLFGAALALAFSGDTAQAQKLADALAKQFPEDTVVQFNYLPTLRSRVALDRNDSSKAIEVLQAAAPYELGEEGQGAVALSLYPVYLRGQAYLASRKGSEAAFEFQKILEHRGVVVGEPIGALAYLQIARACATQGDTVKARAAYKDFLSLWKDADPDIPILFAAKSEYAKLPSR
jgi:DNA-binding winged helix-turn-helix (wHTH) protein/predicted Zn-dependent protease